MMFIPVLLEANERILLEHTRLGSHELRKKISYQISATSSLDSLE